MNTFLIVLGIGTFILAIISLFVANNKQDRQCSIIGIFLGIALFMIGYISYDNKDNPTPIDVYRGKTELKITETKVDSVVVKRDTVVVWKEK